MPQNPNDVNSIALGGQGNAGSGRIRVISNNLQDTSSLSVDTLHVTSAIKSDTICTKRADGTYIIDKKVIQFAPQACNKVFTILFHSSILTAERTALIKIIDDWNTYVGKNVFRYTNSSFLNNNPFSWNSGGHQDSILIHTLELGTGELGGFQASMTKRTTSGNRFPYINTGRMEVARKYRANNTVPYDTILYDLNTNLNDSIISGKKDFYSIFSHEFGHILRLAHAIDSTLLGYKELMFFREPLSDLLNSISSINRMTFTSGGGDSPKGAKWYLDNPETKGYQWKSSGQQRGWGSIYLTPNRLYLPTNPIVPRFIEATKVDSLFTTYVWERSINNGLSWATITNNSYFSTATTNRLGLRNGNICATDNPFSDSTLIRCRTNLPQCTVVSTPVSVVSSNKRNCIKFLQPINAVCYKVPTDTSLYLNPSSFVTNYTPTGVFSITNCTGCVKNGNTLIFRKILNGSTAPVKKIVNYTVTDAYGATTVADTVLVYPNCNPNLCLNRIFPTTGYTSYISYCKHELPQNIKANFSYFGITGSKVVYADIVNNTGTTVTAGINNVTTSTVNNTMFLTLNNTLAAGYYTFKLRSGTLTSNTSGGGANINNSEQIAGVWRCSANPATAVVGARMRDTTQTVKTEELGGNTTMDNFVQNFSDSTEQSLFVLPDYTQLTQFTLYPNPSHNNKVMLVVPENWSNNDKINIRVVDIQGRVIHEQSILQNFVELNLPENAKGVFFVQLSTHTQISTQKLILE